MSRFLRPEPVQGYFPVAQRNDRTLERLRAGHRFRVADHYSTGAEIVSRLERENGRNLLAPIEGHRLALHGARPIGFLADLYPDEDRFFLPFPDVQELHNAWQRYERGVRFAVLGRRLHPFFATYLPTRTEHLELFAQWLGTYEGPRETAHDVGTGSGILAFLLANAGFSVTASDDNPNAIESVRRELERHPADVTPTCADLLDDAAPTDLIVFNPPWVEGPRAGHLDRALVYEGDLFARFFERAHALAPRVVLVFSNIGQLVQPEVPHPIEAELERGRFTLQAKLRRKVRPKPGMRTRERVEIWDLART